MRIFQIYPEFVISDLPELCFFLDMVTVTLVVP